MREVLVCLHLGRHNGLDAEERYVRANGRGQHPGARSLSPSEIDKILTLCCIHRTRFRQAHSADDHKYVYLNAWRVARSWPSIMALPPQIWLRNEVIHKHLLKQRVRLILP
jgi:hypothetical protein